MKKLFFILLAGIFVLSGVNAKKRPFYVIRVNNNVDAIFSDKTAAAKAVTLLKKKNKNVIMTITNTLPLK